MPYPLWCAICSLGTWKNGVNIFFFIFGGYSPAVIFTVNIAWVSFLKFWYWFVLRHQNISEHFPQGFLWRFSHIRDLAWGLTHSALIPFLFDEADGNVAWKLLEQLRLPRVLGLFLLLKINFCRSLRAVMSSASISLTSFRACLSVFSTNCCVWISGTFSW